MLSEDTRSIRRDIGALGLVLAALAVYSVLVAMGLGHEIREARRATVEACEGQP